MTHFDLIIIGGGAGAFSAAIRANELKAKTAMINADLPIGGTCVNVGCVPSKTLIHAAEVVHKAKNHGIPGIEFKTKNFDFKKVIENEIELVKHLRQEKYETVLKHLSQVTYIEGKAAFVSKNEIAVNGKQLFADKFILATGSKASIPSIPGIDDVGCITHIEALRLIHQPRELIIIGAGPVGLEFSQMFSRFGTKVTVLQRGPCIFPRGEQDITLKLRETLENEGISIKTGTTIKKTLVRNNKKIIHYLDENGKDNEVAGDEILVAAGKRPNTRELLLQNVNVKLSEKQAISVNAYFQSSQSHIFAVGDVTDLLLRLEPTAGYEGTLAAENALTGTQKSVDYHTVPYTIFTDPQLAGVGYTESQAIQEIGDCDCRTLSFSNVPKAIIIRQKNGAIKMIVNPKTEEIIGIHILSHQAGELISEAMVLLKNKNTISDVINSLPMFPTLSESLKLVALSFKKDLSQLSCCV